MSGDDNLNSVPGLTVRCSLYFFVLSFGTLKFSWLMVFKIIITSCNNYYDSQYLAMVSINVSETANVTLPP